MTFGSRISRTVVRLLISLACFQVVTLICADADEVPESATITRLIEQLGSAFFEERESAAKELRRIGKPAIAMLEAAQNHKSAEVRSRAAAILRQQILPFRDLIQAFVKQPDDKLDLEEGMWLIARILNDSVQRETLSRQLDQLADAVRKKLGIVAPKTVDPEKMVAVLREVIFEDEKFGGNFDDYQNPANSSLEKVLQTRKGLPILVSHVLIAVGRRLEVPIVGVPTSGRYIAKYDGKKAPPGASQADIYLDPFNNGKVLTKADLADLFGDPDQLPPPQSVRKDLIRMLNNIESHLFNRDELNQAYLAVEFRVALELTAPKQE